MAGRFARLEGGGIFWVCLVLVFVVLKQQFFCLGQFPLSNNYSANYINNLGKKTVLYVGLS